MPYIVGHTSSYSTHYEFDTELLECTDTDAWDRAFEVAQEWARKMKDLERDPYIMNKWAWIEVGIGAGLWHRYSVLSCEHYHQSRLPKNWRAPLIDESDHHFQPTVIKDMNESREQAAIKRLAQCETSKVSWDTTKCKEYKEDNSLFMRDLRIVAHIVLPLKQA